MNSLKQLAKYRLIGILVLALVSATLLLNRHLVPAGDNATYIVLGQSLATGQGYRMISDPRAPEMALYPPGYPLLLAGVLTLTGTAHNLLAAIWPMKVLSVILHLAVTALVYGLFRRRNANLATATAMLVAVNPYIVYYAAEVGTEIPFMLLSLICLWQFERYTHKPGATALLWTALWLVLTFYVRSIALVIAIAFMAYLVAHRRWKHAVLLVLVVGALAAPWFIRSSQLPATGTSVGLGRGYFALYSSSDPYGTAKASLPDLVARVLDNLRIYVQEIWPQVLFPHVEGIGIRLGALGWVAAVPISLLLLLGFCLEARRGFVSEWYVPAFFTSCVGYLWAQSRLVVPIIPFATYYFCVAVDWLLQKVLKERVRLHHLALTSTCVVLLLSMCMADVRSIQRNWRYGLGHSVAEYYGQDPEWRNYLAAMQWIATDSPLAARVMCRKADLMYILTRHLALEYPYSTDGTELARVVRDSHVAYVIEDAFHWTRTTEQYLTPALEAWQATQPHALTLAYETDAPRTRVWRIAEQK